MCFVMFPLTFCCFSLSFNCAFVCVLLFALVYNLIMETSLWLFIVVATLFLTLLSVQSRNKSVFILLEYKWLISEKNEVGILSTELARSVNDSFAFYFVYSTVCLHQTFGYICVSLGSLSFKYNVCL